MTLAADQYAEAAWQAEKDTHDFKSRQKKRFAMMLTILMCEVSEISPVYTEGAYKGDIDVAKTWARVHEHLNLETRDEEVQTQG